MNAAGPTTDEAGLVAVTLAEAHRLFTTLLARTIATTEQILAWSRWRRRHRHPARTAHYRRRETADHSPRYGTGAAGSARPLRDGGDHLARRRRHPELPTP